MSVCFPLVSAIVFVWVTNAKPSDRMKWNEEKKYIVQLATQMEIKRTEYESVELNNLPKLTSAPQTNYLLCRYFSFFRLCCCCCCWRKWTKISTKKVVTQNILPGFNPLQIFFFLFCWLTDTLWLWPTISHSDKTLLHLIEICCKYKEW